MSKSAKTHSINQPHVIPLLVYLGIGAALLILTGVTVATAQFDFGHMLGIDHLNIIIAMIIATFKATLVALFFMHLFYDNKIYLTVFLVSLLTLAIFIALTMFDTMRRADLYDIEGGTVKKQAAMYDHLTPKAKHAEPSKH